MARYERFTFLCDENEKKAIANLATRLQRSQSDAVRFVVIEAAKQLSQTAEDPKQRETTTKGESHVVTT
jgi:hypothetical protein